MIPIHIPIHIPKPAVVPTVTQIEPLQPVSPSTAIRPPRGTMTWIQQPAVPQIVHDPPRSANRIKTKYPHKKIPKTSICQNPPANAVHKTEIPNQTMPCNPPHHAILLPGVKISKIKAKVKVKTNNFHRVLKREAQIHQKIDT